MHEYVYIYIYIHIYIYIYIYIDMYIYMYTNMNNGEGKFVSKTVKLPTRFTRRLIQGSILCTMVTVIFLFRITLFDVTSRI